MSSTSSIPVKNHLPTVGASQPDRKLGGGAFRASPTFSHALTRKQRNTFDMALEVMQGLSDELLFGVILMHLEARPVGSEALHGLSNAIGRIAHQKGREE